AIDHRIEAALRRDHAFDDFTKERRLGRQVLRAFNLLAEPVALELGENVVQRRAGDVHLIERLHRREPRRAALVGLARLPLLGSGSGHRHHAGADRRRLMRTMASAACAASPPLSPSSGFARAHACDSVSTVMMPLPSGRPRATERSINARADWIETMS